MRALDRKLVRELWRLRGQVVAIALVVGSGVAVLIMGLSTYEALSLTTDTYYERYRFAEVFTGGKRVPERIAERVANIPGVQFVETRITQYATLDIDGFAEPAIGRLTSIPATGQPLLNQLALRAGRWIEPNQHDEVIVYEPFAEAHGLALGDRFSALINGHKRELEVVGTALSPEFIYALGPAALLPDDERFGVIWMGREALEAAFDLDEAFNDLSLTLLRGTDPEPVIEALDVLLEPYGGVSAIPRSEQISNWFVENELAQNRTMSSILPVIFLGVAAFLSHMVLSRLIATERGEIGLLKAFGYSNAQIVWQYSKLVAAIALIGCLIGSVLGGLLGRYNTANYANLIFDFPLLIYRPSPTAFVIAIGASLTATLLGAIDGVRRAAKLPPAEAMRPPAPAAYHRGALSRLGIADWLDQPTRIALRQIARWPLRATLTSAGLALSVALLVMALQWDDTIDFIAESFFHNTQHQDLIVGLAEPQPLTAVNDFQRLPGVLRAEPSHIVPAEFTVGTRRHRGGLSGIAPDNRLQPVHDDVSDSDRPVPPEGVLLGSYLAAKLGVAVGDTVWVDVLEGRRPSGYLPVADIFETSIAMPAYMDLDALNRWLKQRPTVEYFSLLVDPSGEAGLFAELKEIPAVSAIMVKRAALDAFYETLGAQLLIFIAIFTGFACALGFGVAYNSTRIALSERGRELATLRVLGFTRAEISYILLGEVAILVLAALPVGCLAGRVLILWLARAFDTELFRMPFVVDSSTYGLAVLFALAASAASAGLVRRRLHHLDLIRVLKTRE